MATVNVRNTSRTSIFQQAAIAGIVGGIIVDAFLAIMMHKSPIVLWQYIASTIVGPGAYASPSYAVLGFIVHFITAIVWAVIYAYVFGALGQLKNWIAGTIVLGIVVDVAMNLLLQVKVGQPFTAAFVNGLLAHIVFYALPVALYMARVARVEPRSA